MNDMVNREPPEEIASVCVKYLGVREALRYCSHLGQVPRGPLSSQYQAAAAVIQSRYMKSAPEDA